MDSFKKRKVQIGNITLGEEKTGLTLIAGPCVIEEPELTFSIASFLKDLCKRLKINLIFKASFDKANRTSLDSFRGPGLKKGLAILEEIKKKLDILITTDIHEPAQAQPASEVVDLIQIPAFLCRQTDLLLAAGSTGKAVNVKKGQFMKPESMLQTIAKIESTGNHKILLTERGTFFGYNDLVVDFRSLPIMQQFGYPVVFDATHSVQQPASLGNCSGGQREYIKHLASAAVAVGCEIIFLEVHPEPEKALCDGPNSLALKDLEALLQKLLRIYTAVQR